MTFVNIGRFQMTEMRSLMRTFDDGGYQCQTSARNRDQLVRTSANTAHSIDHEACGTARFNRTTKVSLRRRKNTIA